MIETIAGLIDLALFISMFVLVYKNNRRIQEIQTQYTELDKKLTKLTKDTKKNHEELLNSFDDKSITIAEGVTDIIETLEDFEVPYEDVGKVIDEKNLPNYKITFSEGYVILLSYDFQTVTLITPDDTSKYSNWTEFKDTLINVLSLIKCPDQENTDGQTEEPKDVPEEPGEDTTET
jgi:uncharacterized protein (DUF342 family)